MLIIVGRIWLYLMHAMPHPTSADNGRDLDNCIVVVVMVVVGVGRDEDYRRMCACKGGNAERSSCSDRLSFPESKVAAVHLNA